MLEGYDPKDGTPAIPPVNPLVIQALAGWSSLRMLERYGHVRDAELNRAVAGTATRLERLQAVATPLATRTIG
jgi:hypothetical protein